MSARMALAPGARLGPYEVTAQIGVGGMGEVYCATDTNLKRAVAIKVLSEVLASDVERLARFQREAEVLAALNHPNIAQIHGLETSDGTTALVMELVEGPTLADRITQGAVSIDEALPIARQIAEALEAAHEQGIIHRDLKPANIKLRPDGVVKVLDFGLAKVMEPAGATAASLSMSPTITTPVMTQAGLILGTAAFMSPEQARGKPIDKRADIWAFGCVLFEMLTGRRAFDAEDVSLTLAEVMKSEPDWTTLPLLPPAVRMCLRQSLKKDPRKRLRDIGEARLALEGALEIDDAADSSGESPTVARRVRRWVLPFAAASAIAAASLTIWLQRSRLSPLAEVVRFEIHAPAGSKIPPGTPAISPDGRSVAYTVTAPDGINRIHLRDLSSTESRVLTGTENAIHPFWSPDGRSLAFVNNRTLKRLDVAGGGAARDLAQVSGPWHGSWNQFGDLLLVSPGLSRMPAEGGTPVPVITFDAKAGEVVGGFPTFLPDGRHFLTHIYYRDGASAIHLASIDSPERKVILKDVSSAVVVAPTPRGTTYLLYLQDDALVAREFDEKTSEVRGGPRVLVGNIGRVANPALMPTIGVSPSGNLAYQTGGDFTSSALYWMSRSGERLGSALKTYGVNGSLLSLSPDETRVAMIGNRPGDRDRGVWVMELARGVVSKITRGGNIGIPGAPVWSPDGSRLAFNRSGRIYVTNADGSTEETVLVDSAGSARSWSSDGKYLLYSTPPGKLFLWPLAGGGTAIPVGSRSGLSRDGRLSPDGHYIAYVSDESGRDEIYLQPLPPATGRIPVSTDGGIGPRWSRTSRELFFVAGGTIRDPVAARSAVRTMMVVDVQLGEKPSAGSPRKLFQLAPTFGTIGYDVSADGQRFLVTALLDEDLPDVPITVVLNWWAELAKRPN
jgi:eukaryotic-like serine/threonine-protein kinase